MNRIEIGNGRVWAKGSGGVWIDGPEAAVRALDIVDAFGDSLRRLTPAEVVRAERGLGPLTAQGVTVRDAAGDVIFQDPNDSQVRFAVLPRTVATDARGRSAVAADECVIELTDIGGRVELVIDGERFGPCTGQETHQLADGRAVRMTWNDGPPPSLAHIAVGPRRERSEGPASCIRNAALASSLALFDPEGNPLPVIVGQRFAVTGRTIQAPNGQRSERWVPSNTSSCVKVDFGGAEIVVVDIGGKLSVTFEGESFEPMHGTPRHRLSSGRTAHLFWGHSSLLGISIDGGPGCVVPNISPVAPAGLTPEQSSRYADATAATLRRLVAEAAEELCVSGVLHSSCDAADKDRYLAAWSLAHGVHHELMSQLGGYVAYGFDPRRRERDPHPDFIEARARALAALGAAS